MTAAAMPPYSARRPRSSGVEPAAERTGGGGFGRGAAGAPLALFADRLATARGGTPGAPAGPFPNNGVLGPERFLSPRVSGAGPLRRDPRVVRGGAFLVAG